MRRISDCRLCHSSRLTPVINLGKQYLSDFRDDDERPPQVPLEVVRCGHCNLVQLRHTAEPSDLYHSRYSFKSGVNEAIRIDLADVVRCALTYAPAATSWLDIASNDGTLLSFVPTNVKRRGIDPLWQFADEAKQHADDVIVDQFDPWYYEGRKFDVITSVSMFYDVDDPHVFVEGVREVLAPNGVWVIQQNYLPAMLDATSVDNISHEHLAYYSMTTLQKLLHSHGLEVNHVSQSPINGGCFRTIVSHRRTRSVDSSVRNLLIQETSLQDESTYAHFTERVTQQLAALTTLIERLNHEGKTIYVYGAGTRGGTLWQAAGLDVEDLPYVVDRNPDKVGKIMSAIGSPIISEEEMRQSPPDYLLVGPWWFRDQFIQRESEFIDNGGKFIFPLPRVEVYPS